MSNFFYLYYNRISSVEFREKVDFFEVFQKPQFDIQLFGSYMLFDNKMIVNI